MVKFIHHIWIQGKVPKPERYTEFSKTWEDNHPDYIHLYWNNESCNILLCDYPQFIKYWNSASTIKKVDLIRYVILHRFGGVYVDYDMISVSKLPSMEKTSMPVDVVSFEAYSHGDVGPLMYPHIKDREFMYQPCFIYSESKQEWMLDFLEESIKSNENIMESVGPWGLNSFIENNNIFVEKLNTDIYLKQTSNSICFHKFEGTWLNWNKTIPWDV